MDRWRSRNCTLSDFPCSPRLQEKFSKLWKHDFTRAQVHVGWLLSRREAERSLATTCRFSGPRLPPRPACPRLGLAGLCCCWDAGMLGSYGSYVTSRGPGPPPILVSAAQSHRVKVSWETCLAPSPGRGGGVVRGSWGLKPSGCKTACRRVCPLRSGNSVQLGTEHKMPVRVLLSTAHRLFSRVVALAERAWSSATGRGRPGQAGRAVGPD